MIRQVVSLPESSLWCTEHRLLISWVISQHKVHQAAYITTTSQDSQIHETVSVWQITFTHSLLCLRINLHLWQTCTKPDWLPASNPMPCCTGWGILTTIRLKCQTRSFTVTKDQVEPFVTKTVDKAWVPDILQAKQAGGNLACKQGAAKLLCPALKVCKNIQTRIWSFKFLWGKSDWNVGKEVLMISR